MKTTIHFCLLSLLLALLLSSCGRDNSAAPGASSVFFEWWDGSSPDTYEPLVIIAAPFGPEFLPTEYPAASFPFNRTAYLNAISACYGAGASVAYVLPVSVDYQTAGDYFDWSWDNYDYIFNWIAENCPGMLIQADISAALPAVQSSVVADTLVNFISPVLGRYLHEGAWQGSSAAATLGNQIDTWETAGAKLLPLIVSPQQADFVVQQLLPGYLDPPFHFAVHIGWENNCASEEAVFNAIISTLPDTAKIVTVCNFDNPTELMGLAIAEGYHLRVGMKDTVYWPGGTLSPVSSNTFLVEKAVELANQLDRPIATPSEAKTILGAYR